MEDFILGGQSLVAAKTGVFDETDSGIIGNDYVIHSVSGILNPLISMYP